MPDSYEHSYQHDLDNVIDASDAVLAIGTEKVDTTTLKDKSLTGNDATIHGAMPSNGYFMGRRFDGDDDYLDCGNDSSLDNLQNFSYISIIKSSTINGYILDKQRKLFYLHTGKFRLDVVGESGTRVVRDDSNYTNNVIIVACATYSNITDTPKIYLDGTECTYGVDTGVAGILLDESTIDQVIGAHYLGATLNIDATVYFTKIHEKVLSESQIQSFFNKLARLPLYSHNFERYPNSDTSLTSVFPYTSGIITSGSFNKTDGLKCTSAGQIVFSNSFEFDGSEYITLVIDGVEYSGTTTVTQGTITATIAQGSNDITIDMGTNDVLEDIQIQFRSEV